MFQVLKILLRGSSAVERSPVKRLVAGSNPARGAKVVKWGRKPQVVA